ncbi:MAG TPA: hypothetical protein VGA37_04340 [Gemmatimonadales bacterium]
MIVIQATPREGSDAFKLLRSKVIHEAATWYWSDKKHTKLRHVQSKGHIDVAHAKGVLVARVVPKEPKDLFYLAEKFVGRLIAWFEDEVATITVQLLED